MLGLACGVWLGCGGGHAAESGDAQVVAMCAGCHSQDGSSRDPSIPVIGGQSKVFLVYSLKAYAAGDWPSTVMGGIARALSEGQIEAAAEHYSRQPFSRQRQPVDAVKAAQGQKIHASLCGKCHIEGGRQPDEYEAILVGQWVPYLRKVLQQYRAGQRAAEKMMLKKLAKLRADEVDALLHYYGRAQ